MEHAIVLRPLATPNKSGSYKRDAIALSSKEVNNIKRRESTLNKSPFHRKILLALLQQSRVFLIYLKSFEVLSGFA